ncbi:MAG: hypothetical protein ACD_58C00338G0004 [uncultured bacterium]|nr:MAG: hypothetical protein ACD_58C00338G0004 [uncultured bacterium]
MISGSFTIVIFRIDDYGEKNLSQNFSLKPCVKNRLFLK